jgi:hypothetical protein
MVPPAAAAGNEPEPEPEPEPELETKFKVTREHLVGAGIAATLLSVAGGCVFCCRLCLLPLCAAAEAEPGPEPEPEPEPEHEPRCRTPACCRRRLTCCCRRHERLLPQPVAGPEPGIGGSE